MKRFFKYLPTKGATRNFITLVSGTTVAQLFSLVFYPIFGRIFSPEDFGVLSALTTVSAIITVIATGKYEQAIIISKSRKEAVNIVALAVGCAACFCTLVLILMGFFANGILTAVNQPMLKGWIYIAPVLSFFIIIYNCFNEWCVKEGIFSSLALNKISNSASLSLSKFGLGMASISGGLIWGDLLGRGLSALSSTLHWLKKYRACLKDVSFYEIKQHAIRHKNFPRYTMPDQIVNTFTGSLPVFFIASYFGEGNLGHYTMMTSIMAIPAVFIGQAVSDVFKNQASKHFENYGGCRPIYNKLFKKLLLLIIIVLPVTVYFLPYIFVFVLGSKWQTAGELARLVAPAIAIDFLRSAFMSVWIIAKKQVYLFYWQLFYFAVMLTAVVVGCIAFNEMKATVACISLAYSVAHAVSIYFTWRFSKGTHNNKQ